MTDAEWQAEGVRAIGLRLAGDAIDDRGPRGERIVDDTPPAPAQCRPTAEVEFRLPDGAPLAGG